MDADALRDAGYTLYRIDGGDNRYYYTVQNGQVLYYVSVTSLIKSTTPTSPGLIGWMLNTPNHDYERDSAAAYGTLFHIEASKLLINRTYDLDAAGDVVDEYTNQVGYREKAGQWIAKLHKDMLALAAWMQDYKVKALAVECVLAHPDGYAGAVDLLCKMTVTDKVKGYHGEVYKSGPRKGQQKETTKEFTQEITAIVDFKTGAHFYDSHEIQLDLYKRMVEHTWDDISVDRLYNWKPKAWRSAPGYDLKDQTGTPAQLKTDTLVKLWRIDNPEPKPSQGPVAKGVIDLDQPLDDNFSTQSLEELLMELEQDGQTQTNQTDLF